VTHQEEEAFPVERLIDIIILSRGSMILILPLPGMVDRFKYYKVGTKQNKRLYKASQLIFSIRIDPPCDSYVPVTHPTTETPGKIPIATIIIDQIHPNSPFLFVGLNLHFCG
jgi:hypothetical protein